MKRLMPIKFILSLLFFTSTYAFSQEIDSLRLDSLISLLTLQKEDESTVDVYNTLTSDYLVIADYETANKYALLGYDLSKDLEYQKGVLESTCDLAYLNLAFYLDFQESINYLDEAHAIAEPLGDNSYLIRIYRGYTSTYASLQEYEKAIEFNNRAIHLAEIEGDQQLISDLSSYGGNIYEEIGETEKAINLYKNVVDIETAANFENTSKAALVTVAHYYYLTENAEKSLKQYRMALRKFQRLQDDRWVAYTHSQMAKIYLEIEDIEMAEKHGLKGLEIAELLNLKKEKADNYEVLAAVYRSKNNELKAEEYQSKYNDLKSTLDSNVVSNVQLINSEEAEVESVPLWDSAINTAVILLLVVIAVLIAGFVGSKK